LTERNTASWNGDEGIDIDAPGTTVTGNSPNRDDDLGIEPSLIDGGGNKASGNGNLARRRNEIDRFRAEQRPNKL